MIYDYQIILGAGTAVLSLIGYALYFRSIFRGITKPHPFSWLLFAFLDGTVFIAQVVSGGGPGAWVLGVSSLMNIGVFLFALTRGEKHFAKIDWACLFLGVIGVVLWAVMNTPLPAVLLAAAADAIAKIPTVRKSYMRPFEESLSIWSLDIGKFLLSLAALTSFTMTTALFPIEAAATNALLVAIILIRRRQLGKVRTTV